MVQIHNYILFFSLFNLKDRKKKFESISLRTSAKFELVIIFVCCMYVCSAGSYNQTNICFSWSFNRSFFLMNNMMILMLMRVHGNFVQQMVTKFNGCDFSKCKYVQGISVHFLLCFSLKSRTCIYFCYFKSCWCMYAYLYLSKHNKDLKKQNFIPLMHLVLFNNPL